MNKINRRQLFTTLAAGAVSARSLAAAWRGPERTDSRRSGASARSITRATWSIQRPARVAGLPIAPSSTQRFGVGGVNYSTRVGGVFQNFNERVMQELFGSGARPRIEFPLAEFNEQIITQELGWAQNVVGLNSLRVFLSVQALDQAKFYTHFERLLEIAAAGE
jgi:hypothetical protein